MVNINAPCHSPLISVLSPDVKPCTNNPITCQNSGTCVNEERSDGSVIAKCNCINQYSGDRCQIGKELNNEMKI